ncbi:MAG: replication-associated recombination protein A, partial [Halobacteriovoraceae bacterium]|nr:replication-associated recombination protein A [Halobacteriovoraceae bacterium]
DPSALSLAVATMTAVSQIGMPEARINLAQATSYLAATVKSNACYKAIDAALKYVEDHPTLEVPNHLRNQHPDAAKYLYPHSYPGHYVAQKYAKESLPEFYQPTEMGREKNIKDRLDSLS